MSMSLTVVVVIVLLVVLNGLEQTSLRTATARD